MAIVEDEVRNESEEENEIEVVVEEDDADEQDSGDDDSDDEGSDDEDALETKVVDLERRISEDPYNYDDHIELIDSLWSLSELERWRSAWTRLQALGLVSAPHWAARLRTESSLVHTPEQRAQLVQLYQQAAIDCYALTILTEWCTWGLSLEVNEARTQMDEVLKRGGADPLGGKLFWDARADFERAQLKKLSEDDPSYNDQLERVLYCVEEVVSRPMFHADESWNDFQDLAGKLKTPEYITKVKKQHEAAQDFLLKITDYEDKLLTLQDPEEKFAVFRVYIDKVKELALEKEKYGDCDVDGILKVLYDRSTYECMSAVGARSLLAEYAQFACERSSRTTYLRVLDSCVRRKPTIAMFWTLKMQHLEDLGKDFDEIKSVLETALSSGLESFREAELVWMCYLEYVRRNTSFEESTSVDRLRRTFRLAWDSLAEAWGDAASDCNVPLYWARLEYNLLKEPKQGKEIFEEIFKYGENKTLAKNWELFIKLESTRSPPLSENKLRELHRRAVKFVMDYPPAVCALWTDLERDQGTLHSIRLCTQVCEEKLKGWKLSFETEKEKRNAQRNKGKQQQNKRTKVENKNKVKENSKEEKGGKRKLEEKRQEESAKRKKGDEVTEGDDKSGKSLKRTHNEDTAEGTNTGSKRQRCASAESGESAGGGRDVCTLFVSNLEFKVNEDHLRKTLSEFGDIVSLRVRAGVKAFGGSICYCQYKTQQSVEEALKHDRAPLDGRPMFLSRYSATKAKPTFRYSTQAEKNKLFVKNLSFAKCTKEDLETVFGEHGKLKDIRIVTHKDGKPKGLAYIEYEDEQSAGLALEKTNGLLVGDRNIEVAYSAPPPRSETNLGQPKRETTGGMRRTQLSSFIPSVLQRASTSKAPTTNGGAPATKTMTNSDFRNMLLAKK